MKDYLHSFFRNLLINHLSINGSTPATEHDRLDPLHPGVPYLHPKSSREPWDNWFPELIAVIRSSIAGFDNYIQRRCKIWGIICWNFPGQVVPGDEQVPHTVSSSSCDIMAAATATLNIAQPTTGSSGGATERCDACWEVVSFCGENQVAFHFSCLKKKGLIKLKYALVV